MARLVGGAALAVRRWRHAKPMGSGAECLQALNEAASASGATGQSNSRTELELASHRGQLGPTLLDHLLGAGKQAGWHGQSKAPCGFQVHEELDVCDALDGKIGWLFSFENASGINPCLAMRLHEIAAVAHQPSGHREVARLRDRRNRVSRSKRRELFTPECENGIRREHEATRAQCAEALK